MDVDEARRDEPAGGVDLRRAGAADVRADLDDAIADDADITDEPGRARPIDHRVAADDHIEVAHLACPFVPARVPSENPDG